MQLADRVRRIATGEEGVVTRVDGNFLNVSFASGRVRVHGDELVALDLDPNELLEAGVIGAGLPYALRLQGLFLKHAYKYDTLSGLSNARIEPALHQVFIAHRVTQKLQPRMILADEVGLGKTIEAGLILKELRARELVTRVLICCPASLQAQWQQELRSKFNEDFEIIDGAGAKFLGRGGANPWAKHDNVICSIPFAANEKQADRIVEAGWDLVIFDEAHRVRRWLQSAKRVSTTKAYRLADELKEIVNGLLLLTATPMQLHPYELYSLIELVEPGLVSTFDEYEVKRGYLPQLNDVMKSLKGWETLSPADQMSVVDKHAHLLEEIGATGSSEKKIGHLSVRSDREELMDALARRHPLSGALVRNRKAEIGGFSRREASLIPVSMELEELELYRDVTAYIQQGYNRAIAAKNMAVGFLMVTYQKMLASSSNAIRQSFIKRVQKLRIQLRLDGPEPSLSDQRAEDLRELVELSDAVEELEGATILNRRAIRDEIEHLECLIDRLSNVRDSKALELLKAVDGLLKAKPAEKLLIFTGFRDTQKYLAFALEDAGYSVAVFNGGMNLEEKEEAVHRFKTSTQILVSTEAGGEGRNFQFCHLLINYDLPWNPMKVEQRIGRLDRFGQTRPVFIYNLFCEDTVEARVVSVLTQRIGLFEESVGSLDPILGEVEREIEQLVMRQAGHFDEVFEEFEGRLEKRVREAREKERTLSDFVLDRASLRSDEASELLNRSPLARWNDLQQFVTSNLDYHGGTLKDHSEGGQVISLSPKLSSKLKIGKSVVRGTFDPAKARQLEDLPFFAFGNDLVDRIVDLSMAGDGNSTGCRRLSEGSKIAVEVFYEYRGDGIRPSGRLIRHLIFEDLKVLPEAITSMPPIGSEEITSPPEWVGAALEASRMQFDLEHIEQRDRIKLEDETSHREELDRAERIFHYRAIRLKNLIGDQAAWIANKESGGSDPEKRILPARKGQLAKRKEELERLRFDYEGLLEEIRSREAGVSAKILAAGLVVGA